MACCYLRGYQYDEPAESNDETAIETVDLCDQQLDITDSNANQRGTADSHCLSGAGAHKTATNPPSGAQGQGIIKTATDLRYRTLLNPSDAKSYSAQLISSSQR